jgi:hypothetical protein
VGAPPSSGIEAVHFFADDEHVHDRGFLCRRLLNNSSTNRWG